MAENKDTKKIKNVASVKTEQDSKEKKTIVSEDVSSDTPKDKTEEKTEVVESSGEVKEDKTEDVKEEKKTEKPESTPAVATKPKKDDKKEELPIELEREYIVPLKRGALKVPRYKRAKKAVKTLKEFLAKHMKVEDRDLRKVKIDIYLNNEIWFRGIKKPANKIKVKAVKRGGIVYVELAEMPAVVAFAKARIERRDANVIEAPKKIKHEHDHDHKDEKDKDGDGVEDTKEEKEDKKSSEEKAAKVNKEAAKEKKHTAKAKTGKEDKQMVHRKAMKR